MSVVTQRERPGEHRPTYREVMEHDGAPVGLFVSQEEEVNLLREKQTLAKGGCPQQWPSTLETQNHSQAKSWL